MNQGHHHDSAMQSPGPGGGSMDSMDAAGRLRNVLTVIFKRKSTILAAFVTVVATVTVGAFLLPPTYKAEAKLLVKVGRENIYRPEVGNTQGQILPINNEEIVNSETGILTSRDLIAKVVSAITAERLYPSLAKNPPRLGTSLDAAVDLFAAALSVEAMARSTVIEVSLLHEDPRMAATALNLLVDFFKEQHLQAYSDPKSSYLQEQLASHSQRLKQSQTRLEAFKQANGVFSLDEQRRLLLSQRAELDTALKAAQNQIAEDQGRVSALQRQLETVSRDVPLSTETERYRGVDEAKGQLLSLQLKEQELLRKYTEDNQLVLSVRREIQIVEAFIKGQEEDIKDRRQTGQNVVYQDLERDLLKLRAELPAQEAKAASLRAQIAHLDLAIRSLDRTEMELANLERDISVHDRNYRTYVEKVQDAQANDELNRQKSANIAVIQKATAPTKPVRPNKPLNLALGVILGALAGLGLALAREVLAQGLATPHSAEKRLGLPVLTTIALKH
jgi:uncharacterized protein involved in exopolysaccharide biosynthesis